MLGLMFFGVVGMGEISFYRRSYKRNRAEALACHRPIFMPLSRGLISIPILEHLWSTSGISSKKQKLLYYIS
jgi:hypothetical protein